MNKIKNFKELFNHFNYYTKPEHDASELLIAALNAIDAELDRVMWNNTQEEYSSPFSNTGNKYKNKTFEVKSYDWDENSTQKFNFKWNNFKISWYKYCGRSTTINKKITTNKIEKMLKECLKSIRKEEKK